MGKWRKAADSLLAELGARGLTRCRVGYPAAAFDRKHLVVETWAAGVVAVPSEWHGIPVVVERTRFSIVGD